MEGAPFFFVEKKNSFLPLEEEKLHLGGGGKKTLFLKGAFTPPLFFFSQKFNITFFAVEKV